MVAKHSAAGERTQTINQARALLLAGPEDLRARFTGHTLVALVAELASLRPRPGDEAACASRVALRARWRGIPAICGHPAPDISPGRRRAVRRWSCRRPRPGTAR